MTQSANSSSQPAADAARQTDSDLFNAIVNCDDVRCDLRYPIDRSTIEVRDSANSKIAYPWNPTLPESADFFNQIEQPELLDAFDSSELNQQASQFFGALDQLWNDRWQDQLCRKFATVPQDLVATIAAQVEQLHTKGNQLLDQLALSVQAALPQWELEDLRVLSRPLAYAMRSEAPESPLLNRDWQTLSTTEQAKLSLLIARYAADQLAQTEAPKPAQ
ncbi:MAG: hypothetical protein RLZZ511_3483 [Cyanobacteriota bacterium]|jgi:hypothetical protein